MGRFNYNDEYSSSSGDPLELVIIFLFLAYAFLFWDGGARLRLTVFLVGWLGLAGYGISIGNTFGVILLVVSVFIALGVTEPISCFIEKNILKTHNPEVDLTEQASFQNSSSESARPEKKTKDPPAIKHGNNSSINVISEPISAYSLGFEEGLNSKKIRTFGRRDTPKKVRESYECGYNDGSWYIADLLCIKDHAVSELDLFLTLLYAFEDNLIPDRLLDRLVVTFNDAVEEYQKGYSNEEDSNQHDEVDFVISELDKLLCRRIESHSP